MTSPAAAGMPAAAPRRYLAILAITQVVTWGSLYYAIAILAPHIRAEMGWRNELVYGAFSWCLLVSGIAATPAGILLDRHGGRYVMGAGSLLCGAGFLLLATAHGLIQYFLAWTVLGVAMSCVLYEGAFATLNREIEHDVRRAISTLTLFGGFASTVFWPATLQLDQLLGWRSTYLAYGAAQLLLCAPLHWLMPARARRDSVANKPRSGATLAEALRHPGFWMLSFAFAANAFIFSALSVHLIPLFQGFGHAVGLAVLAAMLIGPMQVAGRIGEMTFARHVKPTRVGVFTFGMLPAALLSLLLFGAHEWALALFCICYGLSNGILTIVRGTIPHQLFGSAHYGAISGALSGAANLAKAAGPLALAFVTQQSSAPQVLLGLLLAFALASLFFYFQAVRAASEVAEA